MKPEIHWEHTEAKQIAKIKGICRKNVNSNLQIAKTSTGLHEIDLPLSNLRSEEKSEPHP